MESEAYNCEVNEPKVRIVDDEGAALEESVGSRKPRRWTGVPVLIPVATLAALIVASVFFTLAPPLWRPPITNVVVDVYLVIDVQPETVDEVLGLLGSHEAVLDRRVLLQPPHLQGWLSPSECDHRPIVRLLVPKLVDANAVIEFVFDSYPGGPDSGVDFITRGHGGISSPVMTGCTVGTIHIPFKDPVFGS